MLTDLKPCPFCGAQPESPDIGDYFVECPSCGVQGPVSNKDGQPHAKEEWNRRAIEAEAMAETQPHGCTRSHPHENMSAECEVKTVEARRVFWEAQEPAPLDESRYCPDCEALQAKVAELEALRAQDAKAYERLDELRNRDADKMADQAALIEKCGKALGQIANDNRSFTMAQMAHAALASISAHKS